jgi:hypothetical protein
MKDPLLFGAPGSQAMIVPVDPVAILPSQLFDYFCDRVEAMYDQMITEKAPTDCSPPWTPISMTTNGS